MNRLKIFEENLLKCNKLMWILGYGLEIICLVKYWLGRCKVICHSSYTGSIIRCMRRLEELLRQMCQAAKAIGNTELENKFAEGRYFTSRVSILQNMREALMFFVLGLGNINLCC